MAIKTVQKKVYYRKAQFSTRGGLAMQSMVTDALAARLKVKDRLETVDAAASEFRVIGRYADVRGCLCGYVTTFERGRYQVVIADDPDATEVDLAAMAPPSTAGGIPQQFAPGVLYFAIHQNHIAVAQSAALRANGLEQHLSWLLRDTSILDKKTGFVLKDEATRVTKERIRKSHIRSIKIGRPLLEELQIQEPNATKMTSRFKPVGVAISMIRELLSPTDFEQLGIEDRVFSGNLEVWIEIRYPKRKRSNPEDSVRFLDDLGISLRDLDEDQAKLILNSGETVQGSELRVSGSIPVETSKDLPDVTALFDELSRWLVQKLTDGSVDPDTP